MVGLIPQQCMIALIFYRHVVSRMLLGHVTIVMLAVLRRPPIATYHVFLLPLSFNS